MIDSRFKKYEFENVEQAKELINNTTNAKSIVELGFIVLEPAEYNEDFEVIKEAVLNDKYSIEVFWIDEEKEEWKPFKITLGSKKSSHSFSGYEYQDS